MAYDYQRRKELAQAKGFSSVRAWRSASTAERAAASARLAERDPTYKGSGRAVEAATRAWEGRHAARQIVPTAAGTYLRTTVGGKGEAVILGNLDKREGQTYTGVTVRYIGEDGEVHTATIDAKGGNAGALADRMRLHGGVKDYAAAVIDASKYASVGTSDDGEPLILSVGVMVEN